MDSTKFDAIWARFIRVFSFFTGAGIMVYETVGDHSDRPWLYAAAIGMMGLPVARAAEGIMAKWSTQGPHVTPEQAPTTGSQTTKEGKGTTSDVD